MNTMSEALAPARSNLENLAANPYPGDGIAIGINQNGDSVLQVYWTMGINGDDRNRRLEERGGIVRSEVREWTRNVGSRAVKHDVMRTVNGLHLIANGRHLDEVIEGWSRGRQAEASLQAASKDMSFISRPALLGTVHIYGQRDGFIEYDLGSVRKTPEDEVKADFDRGVLIPQEDTALGVATYAYLPGRLPLSRAKGYLPMGRTAGDTAEMYWSVLNVNNRVSIAVKSVHLDTGAVGCSIINEADESVAT